LFNHLDLVAVSIAADIVPIIGENRILAYFGLKKINKNPNIGFKALINVSKLTPPLNISNIVFGIAPKINASGRIGHANETVSLLISNNSSEADRIASLINAKNQIRKDTQEQITNEALDILRDNPIYKNRKSTVLFKPDWHKGVIGIVASKCIDKYYKPTIILTESNGFVTGSARSVSGFDIHEAILKCEKLVEHFGGHKYAAGLSLKRKNLDTFVLAFEKAVSTLITPEQEKKQLKVDAEITFDLINYRFLNILNQMSPFGPANLQPIFIAKNVTVQKALLLKKTHLKGNLKQNGVTYEGIAFNMPQFYSNNLQGKKINIIFNIDENNFRDIKKIQLKIKDIKFTK
jgi:single-stranded-DNA-specific exonuclease